jgi:phage shock protein A
MTDKIDFPPEVTAFKDDPLIVNAVHDNQSQFDHRRESLLRGSEVIEQQLAQAKDEIRQADLDDKTAQQQIDSIGIELPNLKMLLHKGLVALPRVTTLERQLIQVQSQFEGAKISKTKAMEKVAEFQARVDQLKQDYRQEAANALPDVRKTISDAKQQLIIAGDALRRIEIKAPVTGTRCSSSKCSPSAASSSRAIRFRYRATSDTSVVRARVLRSMSIAF